MIRAHPQQYDYGMSSLWGHRGTSSERIETEQKFSSFLSQTKAQDGHSCMPAPDEKLPPGADRMVWGWQRYINMQIESGAMKGPPLKLDGRAGTATKGASTRFLEESGYQAKGMKLHDAMRQYATNGCKQNPTHEAVPPTPGHVRTQPAQRQAKDEGPVAATGTPPSEEQQKEAMREALGDKAYLVDKFANMLKDFEGKGIVEKFQDLLAQQKRLKGPYKAGDIKDPATQKAIKAYIAHGARPEGKPFTSLGDKIDYAFTFDVLNVYHPEELASRRLGLRDHGEDARDDSIQEKGHGRGRENMKVKAAEQAGKKQNGPDAKTTASKAPQTDKPKQGHVQTPVNPHAFMAPVC